MKKSNFEQQIKDFVLKKIAEKGDIVIKANDGREIDVDKLLDGSGFAVSVFEVSGHAYDSDYKKMMPIHKMKEQKKFENDTQVAEYIATLF